MTTPDDQRGSGEQPLTAHPDRLPDDLVWRKVVLAAHDAAVAAGEDGYIDPVSGLFVMTAVYLRDKGPCCDSGCRHCPYGPGRSDAVQPASGT